LTNHLSFFRNIEIKRARQYLNKREAVRKKIKQLERRLDIWNEANMPSRSIRITSLIESRIQSLKAERDTISADYDQRYPPYENLVLPTRFGNILRASETYPRLRWGIDAVTMWPRLIYAVAVAPKGDEYLAKVDISNDQCSFLLNSSLLAGLFSGLALLVALYQALLLYLKTRGTEDLLYFIPVQDDIYIYQQRIIVYVAVSLLALVVFWFFYTTSLYNVSQYGNLIRSTYDIFHLQLLKTLRLDDLPPDELPENTEEEKQIWKRICEFIEIGEVNGPLIFDYEKPKPRKSAARG
jgi:hypothetical protein